MNRFDDFNYGGDNFLHDAPNPSDGGPPWGSDNPNGGNWYHLGGQTLEHYGAATFTFAWLECAAADHEASVDVILPGTYWGIVIAYVDRDNVLFCLFEPVSGTVKIKSRVAGVETDLATASATCQAADRMTAGRVGTALHVKRNGTTVATATSSLFPASTKGGLYGNDATVRVDNFNLDELDGGEPGGGGDDGDGIYTTTQAGNWSNPATWGGEGPPNSTNATSITIAHAVTLDVDVTVGTSPSDQTTLAIDFVSGGSLSNTGHLLRCRGNVRGTGESGAITLGAGGILEFDSSLATTPTTQYKLDLETTNSYVNGGFRLVMNGTANNPAILRGNAGGGKPIVGGSGHNYGRIVATHARLERIGQIASGSSYHGRSADWDHLVLDAACGEVTLTSGDSGRAAVLADCTLLGGPVKMPNPVGHTVAGCVFALGAQIRTGNGHVSDCVFLEGLNDSGTSDPKSASPLSGCAVRWPYNDPVARRGDWSESLVAVDGCTLNLSDGTYSAGADVSNPHWTNPTGAYGTYAVTDCVIEDMGSTDDGDVDYGPNAPGYNSALLRCIGISQDKTNPGTLVTFNGWNGAACTYDHCTWQSGQAGPIAVGESSNGYAGMLASCKSNLFWRAEDSATVFVVGSYNTGSLVEDIAPEGAISHNAVWNCNGTGGVGGGGVNAPLSYDQPDAIVLSADPFADRTRNFSTWVASLDPAWAAGKTRRERNARGWWKLSLKNLPSDPAYDARYNLPAYLAYLREGFAVADESLVDAGHDGATIGAVAASTGPGGGPIVVGEPAAACTALGVTLYHDGTHGSTAPSGGAGPLTRQWHRSTTSDFTPGGGTAISGATGATYSVPSPTTTLYFYKVTVSDGSSSAATIEAPACKFDGFLGAGFLGDSLYYNGDDDPPARFVESAAYLGGKLHAVATFNASAPGSGVRYWLPEDDPDYLAWPDTTPNTGGLGLLAWAMAQFAAAGIEVICLRLGANDGSMSAATWGGHLATIVGVLVGAGYKVVLHYPTYGRPGGSYGGFKNARFQEFQGQIDALVDGTTVFAGDKGQWKASAVIPGWRSDDIHPSATGKAQLALADALALANVLYPAPEGPGDPVATLAVFLSGRS